MQAKTSSVALIALGCPKNIVEAEYLLGIFKNKGFQIAPQIKDADIVIIHTCSFIKTAVAESEKNIKEVLDLKRQKNIKVFVSGCLPQLLKDDLLKKFPDIDGYVGTGSLDKLPQIVQSLQNSKLLDLPAGGLNNSRFRLLSSPLPFTYLKIAEGCNHKCTFCIIGDLRGRYKSRTIKSLIEEAKSLADCGIKELIIIAQDTTSFGIDIYNAFVLDKLLKGLCKISGLKWIRLLYAYPQSINNRLLNVISNNEKVCNYIDIPIQHISRRILSLMQRPPNTRKIIENISEKFPNIVLRTSLIAGFPTETDKDIFELVDFLKQGHFRYAGVFDYSNNALAPSSKLGNQISPQKIKERKIILENAQYEVFKSQIELLKNKEVEVLIESVKKVPEGFDVFARAAFQAPEIDGRLTWKSPQAHQIGSFQKVKIDGLKGYTIKCREA